MYAQLPDDGRGSGSADPLIPGLLHCQPLQSACSSLLAQGSVDRTGGLQLVVMALTESKEGEYIKQLRVQTQHVCRGAGGAGPSGSQEAHVSHHILFFLC